MRIEPLTAIGQVAENDALLIEFEGNVLPVRAHLVLYRGTLQEEIVVNRKKNHYFITGMAIDGTSWAKNVHVVRPN